MKSDLEYLRDEIRRRGFMSHTQVVLEVGRKNYNINLKHVACRDIKKILYTNSYVGPNKKRVLYVYNPPKNNKGKK